MIETRLKAGDAAPDFEGQTSHDTRVRLKDYLGKRNVVLYFYPKDDTNGCTIEACSFRDKLQSIGALWTEVVGVSVDTVESHKKFEKKNRLNFPLISDHDKQISKTYGVLSEDGSYVNRMTFIIDKEGQIARVFTNVDITKHTHEVIDALKRLPRRSHKESSHGGEI
jgi:peroxiredoxin Q/BCP